MPLRDFLPFGAQYYRAPTPEAQHWEKDLDGFKEAGFNTLKYWVQWRWNSPSRGEYDFSDLGRLMELAAERGLRVILNTIFDCAPAWLYQESECRMLTAGGRRLGPVATPCRQIGGAPGPCLNHPGARAHRLAFLEAAVQHFKSHPALFIWDTWNEPELSGGIAREARIEDQVCYCEHCRQRFVEWLEQRYGGIEGVNKHWRRNYRDFSELELPVNPQTYGDAIDWRMFQVETVSREQRARADLVRQHDPNHIVMCHTVPMPVFNPVTCGTDEWDLAETGDLVGNSLGSDPLAADLIRSAGGGRPAINSEIHAIPGTTLSRPKPLDMADCKRHIFTPLGHGIKGFIFWQYRPELLGLESPAWGMTRADGSTTPWREHWAKINAALQKDAAFYLEAEPEGPEVGILYHPENHIFCWCAQGSFELHDRAIRGAYEALFRNNYRVRFVHPRELREGTLEGISSLLYPFPYLLDDATAKGLRAWVREGGCLIGEAFFANYERDRNLHAERTPGCGMHELFGLREGIVTPYSGGADLYADPQGLDSGERAPIVTTSHVLPGLNIGHEAPGHLVQVPLEVDDAEVWGHFEDSTHALTCHQQGEGKALYVGTLLTAAALHNARARDLLAALAAVGDDRPRPGVEDCGAMRVDVLRRENEWAVVLTNLGDEHCEAVLHVPGAPANAALVEVVDGQEILPNEGGGWQISLDANTVELYRLRA